MGGVGLSALCLSLAGSDCAWGIQVRRAGWPAFAVAGAALLGAAWGHQKRPVAAGLFQSLPFDLPVERRGKTKHHKRLGGTVRMASDGKVPARGFVRNLPAAGGGRETWEARAAVAETFGLPLKKLAIPDTRVRLPSNLCRKGIWLPAPDRARTRLTGTDMLGEFAVVGGRLTVFDLDVVAWLSTRWLRGGEEQIQSVEFTLYEMAANFFGKAPGRDPSGRHYEILVQSLDRLGSTQVSLVVRSPYSARRVSVGRVVLIPERWAIVDELRLKKKLDQVSWRELAGQRGVTVRVTLTDWWLGELRGGQLCTLPWRGLRKLTKLSKRLYYQLEADSFKLQDKDNRVEARWYAIERPFLAQLGMRVKEDHRARLQLVRAVESVCEVDERYLGAELRRQSRGRWLLVVRRRMRARGRPNES